METLRRSALGVLVTTSLALGGCYAYSPVGTEAPGPGAEVRATLSEEGARRLARPRLLGAGNVLTGNVLVADGDSLTLSVRRRELRGVERFGSRRDTVALATRDVASLEKQKLKVLPTAAVAAAAGGGMVAAFGVLLEGASGQAGQGDGSDPKLILFSVPFGR